VLARAQETKEFVVVPKKTIYKKESFADILHEGKKEKILQFIEEKNILNKDIFKFTDIYWLLKDKGYYFGIINILKKRGIFEFVVWSYSFMHNDVQTIIEFFQHDRG